MKFELKKYPFFKLTKQEKQTRNNTELLINNELDLILSLPEIINHLNNNKTLLNIKDEKELFIIFEDFNWLGKIKNKIENYILKTLNTENLENSIAHYNSKTKSIHIFNGIIEPKSNSEHFKREYNQLINSVSDFNFIINFFVLHEIGHAIYDQVINNKKYNNISEYFKKETSNYIHQEQNLILHENFADMFASISYLTIDNKNSDLIKNIELFSDFRKNIRQEKYYTFNNIDKLINDFKNDKLQFKNNDEFLLYININTDNEIKIRLKERLESILNSQEHNYQLSYFSNLFKLNDKSFNGIVSYLEKEINYRKPYSVIYEPEFFEQNHINDETNKTLKRIKSFHLNLNNTDNISTTKKNKI